MRHKKALLIIDLQNDFCKGGNLAVPGGEEIVPLINQLQLYFDLIIATQDWHPSDHISFASSHQHHKIGNLIKIGQQTQILWPDHCVQHSKGADFHPQLNLKRIEKILQKGIDKNIDSYSAFFDNAHLRATGLNDYLHEKGVKEVYLAGLATDYCVKYSALDALSLGYQVSVIVDACRGVDLKPNDVVEAFEEMRLAGVELISSKAILNFRKSA